jgi:hypothetical protein
MRKADKRSRTDRLWNLEDRAWVGRWNPENTPKANSWWQTWYYRVMKTAAKEENKSDS